MDDLVRDPDGNVTSCPKISSSSQNNPLENLVNDSVTIQWTAQLTAQLTIRLEILMKM